jgi:hypothetical protein
MTSTTGVISKITPRNVNTARGPATVHDVLINGISISTFKLGDAKEGDSVMVEYTQNGNYFNMVNMSKAEKPVQSTLAPVVQEVIATDTPSPIDTWTALKLSIMRNGDRATMTVIEADARELLRIRSTLFRK